MKILDTLNRWTGRTARKAERDAYEARRAALDAKVAAAEDRLAAAQARHDAAQERLAAATTAARDHAEFARLIREHTDAALAACEAHDGFVAATGDGRIVALDDASITLVGKPGPWSYGVITPDPAPWTPPAACCPPGCTITAVTPTTPLPVGTRVVTIRESWDEDTVPVGSTGTVTQPPPLLAVAFDHDPIGDGGPDGAWAMFGHQLAVLHEPANA